MMKHAYGYDSRAPGFRDHYCTSLLDNDMKHLVEIGVFSGPHGVGLVGEGHGLYYLTQKGKDILNDIRKCEEILDRKFE
jgi:hypothetical protein